jgi:hypothetical protein
VELERLLVTEARKTLGVKKPPIGENTVQIKHMLEVSHKWAAQIKASNLRQIDAWLALHYTIWKTLEYPQHWEHMLARPYTPRNHNIPAIKATGMKNKDIKEGTQNDVTRST